MCHDALGSRTQVNAVGAKSPPMVIVNLSPNATACSLNGSVTGCCLDIQNWDNSSGAIVAADNCHPHIRGSITPTLRTSLLELLFPFSCTFVLFCGQTCVLMVAVAASKSDCPRRVGQ